ncbi:AAA family ATPase [Leptolyngbya ohadii]|uniref:AAA family ATPase n=1 Tax=Leptolyngbya ohadii TaxID=1962290 RepID=UPI000B599341|nr:AAA family ATPase [Leptolyngbya ohadii]
MPLSSNAESYAESGAKSNTDAPLAARMRPRSLDEFIGQDHILGAGRLLRRAIQADQLSSLIFYGPPGTGKTTLARIIANTTQAHFISLNAVLSGVKEIRAAIDSAQEQRQQNQRTILFVDEVHRFNKAQQDALLPWVENGTVILIGATTENPYFEVNKALVSRSRIFQLKPLSLKDLYRVVKQALQDDDRGYGKRNVRIDADALDHLVNVANGDARALLNALELAVETTPAQAGEIQVTLAVAEESIQQRAVLYDKEGDVHFDTISALIKSIRGSDPDAALYWLARMVYAGEDPRFIFRRLLILASEDVGLADPNAVAIVIACAQSFDRVGLPEGRYPLAQATLYLATAPKSNSVMGFFDALSAVEKQRETEVPNHLRDANRDRHSFGHGANYLYPHAYRDHWVAQQYLPGSLQGQMFYQPSDQGKEADIQQQVARLREAQIAALVEGIVADVPEVLTYSPPNRTIDRWLQRTLSQTGTQLGQIRDRIFTLASPQRHHVILDANAGSGLLVWEAVRQVPEGGVYAWVKKTADAEAIREQAEMLPEVNRPIVLVNVDPAELQSAPHPPNSGGLPNQELSNQGKNLKIQFDRMIGRNVLLHELDKAAVIQELANYLRSDGQMVLAETLPRETQRLYELVDQNQVKPTLLQRWIEAEEAIYQDITDPMVNWDEADLPHWFTAAGLQATLQREESNTELRVTDDLLDRWFRPGQTRPSYSDRLAQILPTKEQKFVQQLLTQTLRNQTIQWRSAIVFVQASRMG